MRIRAAIDLLSETPRPPNCVALVGESSVYRVRADNYRILYEMKDNILQVLVVRIGHRREVYRWGAAPVVETRQLLLGSRSVPLSQLFLRPPDRARA